MLAHRVTLATRAAAQDGHIWLPLAAVGTAALPAPVKKLLLDLASPGLFG
jgi:A/G-specific adenine glycosylase